MIISFVNTSLENYGADLTMKFYYEEAKKRGHEAYFNKINNKIQFYCIGMHGPSEKRGFQQHLKLNKFVYIEHSVECILNGNEWIRGWLMHNSYKNFFFSPRHHEHISSALGRNYDDITKKKYNFLVVPVDYNLFKTNINVKREDNLYIFVGLIHSNKGVCDIFDIAEEHQENKYVFIGSIGDVDITAFDKYKNVKYVGHLPKEKLPDCYSRAKGCYLLPCNGAVESAGRTIFEAVMCGCEPMVNENVGNASYPWFTDRDKLIEKMNKSVDYLFNTMEAGMAK